MSTKYQKDSDEVGYYVEGDYMIEETNEKTVTYTSPTSPTGFKLEIIDHTILITGPHKSVRSYTFDNKEDWENFCEATWQTDNYIAMKRTHFVEFFRALQFVYSYHKSQMDMAKKRQAVIQKDIDEQDNNLSKLQDIIIGYEEVYNESKV